MSALPMEFWEEDELLAEFHRAGIILPDERERMERIKRERQRMGEMMAQQMNIANQQRYSSGALMNAMQQRAFSGQQQNVGFASPFTGAFGGSILGSLLGR